MAQTIKYFRLPEVIIFNFFKRNINMKYYYYYYFLNLPLFII